MKKVRIKITNAEFIDDDTYEKESTCRILNFPDGLSRHIKLHRSYWEWMDWLVNVNGEQESDITVNAFEIACTPFPGDDAEVERSGPDFENSLRLCVRLMIEQAAKSYSEGMENVANEL